MEYHLQIFFVEYNHQSQSKGTAKGEVQRGTLAPRSALGEHTLYGVKYSVLYFTLKYHGEKRNEVVK